MVRRRTPDGEGTLIGAGNGEAALARTCRSRVNCDCKPKSGRRRMVGQLHRPGRLQGPSPARLNIGGRQVEGSILLDALDGKGEMPGEGPGAFGRFLPREPCAWDNRDEADDGSGRGRAVGAAERGPIMGCSVFRRLSLADCRGRLFAILGRRRRSPAEGRPARGPVAGFRGLGRGKKEGISFYRPRTARRRDGRDRKIDGGPGAVAGRPCRQLRVGAGPRT